ncbi:uncharacterized protein LOC132462480 [Gadus macrocephalus]|uniref:uncharacterized protein LOC132462480 n=1 Tax=Gadus macrocephalus TaxID=80720 RepID=UPI0028CB2982|nr:uncharacterized protein LOC132462480 [Gadus macrocephalus]
MVPEEVRVSWRRRGGGGGGGKDGEQLELRAPTYAASILVIDQGETLTDQYICRVEHESGLQKVEVPAAPTEMTLTSEGPGKTDVTLATAVTTDPRRPGRPREGPSDETHQSLQVLSRARLASVLYTVMVVKSVLCCCGLALLLLHTNKTSRTPRTSTTTALDASMVHMAQYNPHRPLWCTWTSINQYGLCVGGVPESLQVLSVFYTVMVVKSVLCCCGLALLLLHTNKTSRTPRTSTTTALD